MCLLDIEELANMIRRECEARRLVPPGCTPATFEFSMAGFNRRYLEEMCGVLGICPENGRPKGLTAKKF